MPGWNFFHDKFLFVLVFTLTAALASARNAVRWNYINLPTAGSVGDTVQFTASVTNQGDLAWSGDHYIEVRDGGSNGKSLLYVSVADTAPGATRDVVFALKLPAASGTQTYVFTAVQHGVEYFGASEVRTLGVPIDLSSLPSLKIDGWNFPTVGGKHAVPLASAHVGDVVSIASNTTLTAGSGWRHNILVRRPGITATVALAPEDGSGLNETTDVWNKE